MKPGQERISSLLADTISLICRNGLNFENDLRIQAVIGVTLDNDESFIVHINKCFERVQDEPFEDGENGQYPREYVQNTGDKQYDAAPQSFQKGVMQSATDDPSFPNEEFSPTTASFNQDLTSSGQHQAQGSANSFVNGSKADMRMSKSRPSKHETNDDVELSPSRTSGVRELSPSRTSGVRELSPSKTNGGRTSTLPYIDSDDGEDTSAVITESAMLQRNSAPPKMSSKQLAVNGSEHRKSSQRSGHKLRHSVDEYRPKTKKRDICEDLLDAEDDSCDDFSIGQQYMYIDARKSKAGTKGLKQRSHDVLFDPRCTPSMLDPGIHNVILLISCYNLHLIAAVSVSFAFSALTLLVIAGRVFGCKN